MKIIATVLLSILAGLFALALAGCAVQRNADGTTSAGMQVTAADVLTAWDAYETRKVRASK